MAIQALARLRLRVRARHLPFSKAYVLCGRPRTRAGVCATGWFKDFADAQTILDPVFNGQSITPNFNPNESQLDVPSLNRAMNAAALLVDPAARARAWAAIDRRVMKLAPGAGWTWPKSVFMASRDVVEVPNPGAYWDLAFMARR